jgi:hypothetical protein
MKRKYKASDWYMSVVILISGWVWLDTGNGFSAIIVFGLLWLIGIPFRAGAWASGRLNSRPCQVCGNRVANGETQCGSCGTDFRLR